MTTARDISDELRATREELVRAERRDPYGGGPTTTPSARFPWLRTLSRTELAAHADRLEGDLADATHADGFARATHADAPATAEPTVQRDLTAYGGSDDSDDSDEALDE